ncbi:MAG TPA: hypothetical protein VMG12_01785 [Polyangiaceae bacterium]|nr:hypothetical protein [Polyangiaceae bacterium]
MLKRILGFSVTRFAAVTALLALFAGCNRAETSTYGHVDIVPSGLRSAACDTPVSGQLQLDGLLVNEAIRVSAEELCHHWVVRKELPSGLYTVSWQASADAPRHEVREAGIVNVFPEQTTTLRLLRLEPEAELSSQALLETATQ